MTLSYVLARKRGREGRVLEMELPQEQNPSVYLLNPSVCCSGQVLTNLQEPLNVINQVQPYLDHAGTFAVHSCPRLVHLATFGAIGAAL